ncbi:MAG: hypothetical protein IKE55_01755 [Kiritimatiellae bacterium]|nr:hypothetical protein [Kiritimatiellia bacterium]
MTAPHIALALALCSAAAPAAAGEPEASVKWICPQETFAAGMAKPRYYRRAFNVSPGLRKAVARWWLDDVGEIFLDGKPVSGRRGARIDDPADFTAILSAPGRHCLAVRDANLAAKGGVCLALELCYADGSVEHVHTDRSWRCAKDAAEGWEKADFDDSSWDGAKVHDDIFAGPWSARADMTLLLPRAERDAVARFREARDARLKSVLAEMEKEPKPTCRIGYDRGNAYFDIGGRRFEPTFYNASESWHDDNRKLRRQTAYFRDAGVHLFGLGLDLETAWRPDGTVDVKFAEEAMRSALAIDPEARFFVCLSAVLPPRWWAAAHPDELVGYIGASADVNQRECLKNCAAPSAASRAWRRDFVKCLGDAVAQFEGGVLSRRIFAYRVDWGINHEWHYYGMRGMMPDNGKAMTDAFREWLRRAYGGDVDALRKAWNDGSAAFETASTPSAAERLRKSAGRFRDPVRERRVIDYERCHAQVLRSLLIVCNKAVKEACGGRALVGNYCGYYFGVPETAEGWHLENDAILDSPYVDFQCSPSIYGAESRRRGCGQYARCLLEGLRSRGKLAILEADNSTTTSETTYCRYSDSTEADIALLARDFAQTLCWGCGYWYFDFGQGWYEDPAFRDFFAKIYPIRRRGADCRSVSEVLVVGDYESVMFTHAEYPPTKENLAMTDLANALCRAGAPFDSASMADVASGRLKAYKAYIFPNLHYATDWKRAVARRLRGQGAKLAWIGEPGAIGPEGAVAAAIAEPEDTAFGAAPNRAQLRAFLSGAGVHLYNDDADASVYANASYVALHNASAGRRTIRLPRAARVTELYPGRRLVSASTSEFSFDARGPATTIFLVE